MFYRLAFTIVSVVLLTALFVYLFYLPLKPSAWGGPRGTGPFEDKEPVAAGRFARDARLHLESIAKWRSPNGPLEATAEALAGYYALLSVVRFAILWFILLRLSGCGVVATLGVATAALPIFFGAPRQDELDVGLVLFVILLGATTSARIPRWVACGALPALFALWANAHTSAVVGLAWLVVLSAGRTIEWRQARRRGSIEPLCVGRFLVTSTLCVLATCLNPDGPQLLVDAFKATKNPSMGTLSAWQPMDFSKPAGMPWYYLATLTALLIAQLASERVLAPTALIVILTFGFWPLVQQRGQSYWWIIVPWLLVPMTTPILRRCAEAITRKKGKSTFDIALPPRLPSSADSVIKLLAIWVVVGVAAAICSTPPPIWFITGKPRSMNSIVSSDTPVRLALELSATGNDISQYLPELREVVRASYPNGQYRGAILCGEAQGDFLAWVLDGDNDRPVILYTRPETIGRDHWADARQALDGRGDWWEITGRQQVNLIVIDAKRWPRLAERLRMSSAWRIVQRGIRIFVQDDDLLVAVRLVPKLPVELQEP